MVLPDGTPEAAVTRYEANVQGQVTAVISPIGIRSEVEHEPAGTLRGFVRLRRYDAGALGLEWRYGYDALGREETITAPSGAERAMIHDALDRVIELRAPMIEGMRRRPGAVRCRWRTRRHRPAGGRVH